MDRDRAGYSGSRATAVCSLKAFARYSLLFLPVCLLLCPPSLTDLLDAIGSSLDDTAAAMLNNFLAAKQVHMNVFPSGNHAEISEYQGVGALASGLLRTWFLLPAIALRNIFEQSR